MITIEKAWLQHGRTVAWSLGTLLAVTSIGLAGCGASAPTSSSIAPSVSPTATPPTCLVSSLNLSLVQTGVATGHVGSVYRLTNTGESACTLEGYPTLQLLDAQGHPLPAQEHQTTSAFTFQARPPQTITLAHGQSAYLYIDYADLPAPGQTCVSDAAAMTVTPPEDTASLQTSAAPDTCGPINVAPLQAVPLG